MQVVIFSSPQRSDMLKSLLHELKAFDVSIIDSAETFGKENFWMRWKEARQICLDSKHDNYLILPDDISDIQIKEVKQIFKQKKDKLFTCNISNDGRKKCWGGDYFDCGGLTNRKTLEKIKVTKVGEDWFKKAQSSGVGYQLTMQLRKIGAELITPEYSLCYHGTHDSVMHYEYRKANPLVTKNKPIKLKIVVGMATFAGREKAVERAMNSLVNQVDEIILYDNEKNPNLYDNGKFYGLKLQRKPCYYFTADDDLIYPSNFVQTMIEAIEKHKTIVTHHGRKLQTLDVSYYRGHKSFRCLDYNNFECLIDVPGTGVTAFRTDYFNPKELYKAKDVKMSDIIFGLEAKKQGKKITVLKHSSNWIKQIPIDHSKSIHTMEHTKEQRQIELANEIIRLK
jgi:hypothetical protein